MSTFLKRKRITLITCLLLIISLTIVSVTIPDNSSRQRYHAMLLEKMINTDDFSEFSDNLFKYEVTSDSISTAYNLKNPAGYGIPELSPDLSSFTKKGYEKDSQKGSNAKLYSALLNNLESLNYNSLSEKDKTALTLIKRYLEINAGLSAYPYYEDLIGSQSGIQANLPITLSEYPLRTKKDIDTYLILLSQFPGYFENIIGYEKERNSRGFETPIFSLRETKDGLDTMIKSLEDGTDCFSRTFRERTGSIKDLDQKQKAAYQEKNRHYIEKYVLPAYKNLYKYVDDCISKNQASQKADSSDNSRMSGKSYSLKESSSRNKDYLPDPDTAYGLKSLPDGDKYYALLVSLNTGSDKSVPELIDETERTLKESLGGILKIAVTDPESYLYYCDHEPDSYYQSPEAILEALSLMIKKDYPSLHQNPKYKVKQVPESLQAFSSPAFYMIPAMDDYDDNTIYINPIYTGTQNGNLFTTLAHEGFPGHLYQTVYYSSTSPAPVRQILDYPGYVEGWATYVEMNAFSYMNFNDKPSLNNLYQADTLINLAICSRIDLGVNYEGWTLNDVNAFFEKYGFKSYYAADIYSYVVQAPATYLRYFIGYLEILEIKDEYRRLKMENFSEKEFHRLFLEAGPGNFSTVREQITGPEK